MGMSAPDSLHRIAFGGRIDRNQRLSFTFEGERLVGVAGDTLASALLANGIRLVGRSFKYHRPRGILSDGADEPNALVQVGYGARTIPNLRATQVELYAGLTATSQNCWPSVRFDIGAISGALSPLIPAGFYYKTFMWPANYWMKYEYFIRRAAGLGRAPTVPDPDTYDKMHVHCDVLVVGAGPAGLAAAHAAGRTGAQVILVDEQSEPGGYLLGRRFSINGSAAMQWVEAQLRELNAMEEVLFLPRTTVSGYYDHNYLTALERCTDHISKDHGARPRQRLWKIRAKQVVLATGAHERPLVFRNNDRPGVMLASAAQTYVNRYAVRPGSRAVICTNNNSAYSAASDLAACGIETTLVDLRPEVTKALIEQTSRSGVEVIVGHAVANVHGLSRVRTVSIGALNAAGNGYREALRQLSCDLVCMSGGWSPVVHLFSQSCGEVVFDSTRACFVPGRSAQPERSAGACNGAFELTYALAEGREAGKVAAAAAGFRKRGAEPSPVVDTVESAAVMPCWIVPSVKASGSKHFVDFQNDVTAADIALAVREGYSSPEHLKRYTTLGMGTDQGKTSNVNGLGILAAELGQGISQKPGARITTTFRPPYTPITFGALAGRDVGALADPIRCTAMHQWHTDHGALFEDVGQWKRPWYYPRSGESMLNAVNRECVAARTRIGIMDASTLGKIDIQGADTVELLNRIYTNGWKSLAVGRGRYGLMCGDDGMVFDDGVTLRLSEHRYLMHTTSGGAGRVLAWLEEWLQTEWPYLKVYCNSVTEQWATASVAGPFARLLLAELCADIDLDAQAFPFMSVREGTVAGIPARIIRVSFSGELSFEINVPADYGLSLWTALMITGAKYGITPYGTETMHVLRAEKGFIIVGQDTDGTVTPVDLGMEKLISKHKDFIGKRSLSRTDCQRLDRKQLVGLMTERPGDVLPEGAQIVDQLRAGPPMAMIGHVTSSYWSENLKHSIALALVRGGHNRIGQVVNVPLPRKVLRARITSAHFFDANGERMHG